MTAFSEADQRILECVDCGLETLGGDIRQMVYYHVEKKFQLKKREIPERPEVFKQAIVSIFGEEGANTIEDLIVQEMRKSFKLKPEPRQTFTNLVSEVRTLGDPP